MKVAEKKSTKKSSVTKSPVTKSPAKRSSVKEGIKVDRKKLLTILHQAEPALNTQEFIPILSHFCFDGEAVTAYNDIQAIRINYESVLRGGLPGSMLIKILESYSQEKVEIIPGEIVEFRSGHSRSKLASMKEEFFLFDLDELDLSDMVEVPLNQSFIEGIGKCLLSVGNNPVQSAQRGITFSFTKKKPIVLYSTDNYSCSKFVTDCVSKSTGAVIVPKDFCETLLRFLTDYKSEKIVLKIGDGFAVAEVGESAILYSKLVTDSKPLNFERIFEEQIPEDLEDELQAKPEDLKAALERSLIVQYKSVDKILDCEIKGDKLFMTAVSSDNMVKDVVIFKEPPSIDKFSFKIDPSIVLKALDQVENICFTEELLIFTENTFTHLIGYYRPN